MSQTADIINLYVQVNGNDAQNKLTDMRKRAADLNFEMKGLKKTSADYIDKAKELDTVKTKMAALQKQIGITGLTLKELRQEQTRLQSLFSSAVPFSKQYTDLEKSLVAVKARIYDVSNGVQGLSSLWSRLGDQVKQFGALALGYLGFQFLSSQISSIISGAGKLSDQLADLQRVAGLTKDEANSLNKSLKEIDTRTSTGGLREIAIIAGKLGVAKDDIFEFTKAVDHLVVALGDELGDADQITTQLGKILNVFDGKVTGDNISKLGNAMVQLANTGVATGGFIADFDQRLSGLAKATGISLGALSGLGAGMEELGSRVESSTTAVQRIIITMNKDMPKAAKIAGMSVDDFRKLFTADATEALLRYAEGLVKNKASFEEFTTGLKDAGEEGQRTIETLNKMGASSGKLRERIDLGKKSIEETGAITSAFNLKNQTLGAELDKLGKEFNRLVTSSAVTNFLKSAVESTITFIKWLKDLPNWLKENRTAMLALMTVIVAYTAAKTKLTLATISNKLATILETAADKIQAAQTAISTAYTKAYTFAKDVLTGKIKLATVAQQIWNTVIKENPLVWLAALVLAVATAISAFSKTILKNTEVQQNHADILAEVNKQNAATKQGIEEMTAVMNSSTAGVEEKKLALEKLKSISNGYLDGLTMENFATKEGTLLLQQYVSWLDKSAEAKARAALKSKLLEQSLESENKLLALEVEKQKYPEISGWDKFMRGKDNKFFGMGDRNSYDVGEDIKKEAENKKMVNLQLSSLNNENNKIIETLRTNIAKETATLKTLQAGSAEAKSLSKKITEDQQLLFIYTGIGDIPAPGVSTPVTPKSVPNKKLADEAAQFAKEMEKLQRDILLKGKNLDDSEVAAIEVKYADLFEKAKKYSFSLIKLKGMENEELQQLYDKRFKIAQQKSFDEEYANAITETGKVYDELRNQAGQDYANKIIDKKTYTAKLETLDLQEKESLKHTAADYVDTVKKAADDLVKYTADAEHAKTAEAIKGMEERSALTNEEALAKAKIEVIQARDGSKEKLQAQKNLLQLQFDQDTAFMDKKSQMYLLKEAELQKQLQDLDQNTFAAKLQNVLQYIQQYQQAFESLVQILGNRDARSVQKDKASSDAKAAMYKQQLDGKLISQSQYDIKMQALQDANDQKQKEADRAQAKREKALAEFQAFINTALAVTKFLALGQWGKALLAGIEGGLAIGAIATKPLPQLGLGDWVRDGNTHANGGVNRNIERNEAVIRAAAMTDPNTYSVTGTTAQITSKLNSLNGGISWAQGATLFPRWRTDRPAQISSTLPGILAANNSNASSSTIDFSGVEELLKAQIKKQDDIVEELKNMKTKLHAVVSIKEFRKEEKKYDDAKKSSSLNQ